MLGRATPVGVVLLLFLTACSDDAELVRPVGANLSYSTAPTSGSGIFNGAEAFAAGNPMANFAGGAPYNFGYYSTGPDPDDGWYDSDRSRIEIPNDSLIAELSDFSFEAWIRPSYSSIYEYGLIAINSTHMFNSGGGSDFGYFLLDFYQGPGWMEMYWTVASYSTWGWSTIYADAPPVQPDSAAIYHVVGVHENDVIKLFINGQLAASADISGESGLWGPNDQQTTGTGFRQDLSDIYSWSGEVKPLMIGGVKETQADSNYLSVAGSIGESAFYRRALTATEVQEHYQVGTATPPLDPDSVYDPYAELVLSDSAVGYWRHRESELHGQPSIDGEQVVDASGNDWHGTYRSSMGGVPVSLTCTPTVSRGDQVTCQVLGTDVTVTGWTFENAADTLSSVSTSTAWTGPGVVGGSVTAHVSVAGVPQDLTSSFEVLPRPWRWGGEDWDFDQGAAPVCFDSLIVANQESTFGWNRRKTNCESGRLNPQLEHDPNAGYEVAPVTTGPNAGLWYVTAVSFRMDRGSNINPNLSPGAIQFALPNGQQAAECRRAMGLQGNEPVGVNFFSFNTACKGKDLEPMFDGIWAHEG